MGSSAYLVQLSSSRVVLGDCALSVGCQHPISEQCKSRTTVHLALQETGPAAEHWRLLQQWTGIVTAILEHLPPDSSVVECLGLMSISFNDQWRGQALGQIERDPTVLDRLVAICPDWADIVETILETDQRRPIKAGRVRAR